MDKRQLESWFKTHHQTILDDFFTFLKFESIATDPQYDAPTKACAKWLETYLRGIGLEVESFPTSGQPILLASHLKAGKDRPTLMIYQHYDVQPVDPLELWKTPPFKPHVHNGQVYARGAQDNKGQCFYTITAIKALLEQSKTLNFNLKLFIDGEEESGSKGAYEVLKTKKDRLKSDYLLIVDSGLPKPNVPAITLGCRGILTMELVIESANTDMHSGGMGGVAYNPNRALVQILSTLWEKEGKIAISHFYDQVASLSKEEEALFSLELDEAEVIKDFGLKALAPEPGYSIGKSQAIRPTMEINGISGGYAGEGFKTVIPAIAKAKLSCRLVPDQDPQEIFAHLKAHILSHAPKGLNVTLTMDQGVGAFRSNPQSKIAKLCAKAYEEVMNKPCQAILIGGSIPISVELANVSGAQTVLMGYGLETDKIHAPNEHFGLDRFEQGFLTMGLIFNKLNES